MHRVPIYERIWQRLNTANNRVSGTGFTYDAAGNLTSDGTNNYMYDADGNVSQQGTTPYIYDALNHQVGQTFSSTTSTAVAFDKDGNFASLWVVSSGNSLSASANTGKAYWNGTAFESYNSSTAFFEHRDWVGSRRAATNTAKTVTNLRTSLPFGDGASNISGSRDNTYDGFTGLWEGGSAASNHAQFRDYWNVAGRWLQPDPYYGSYDISNPQSFNRYAYVLNNPVKFVDPLGLDANCEEVTNTYYDDDGNVIGSSSSTTCTDDGGGGFDCSQLPGGCLGSTPNPPSNPGSPGGNAPNKPKSPARLQCEANAAHQFVDGVTAENAAIPGNLKPAAGEGFVGGLVGGCIAGAVLTSPGGPTAFAGCVSVAVPAALWGAFTGPIVSFGHSVLTELGMKAAYDNQINNVCSQL